MDVRGIRIDWMLGWMNRPQIYLWVDSYPKNITLFPERRSPIQVLWYGEDNHKVSFYADTTLPDSLESKQEDGFGGRHIKIWTEDVVHTLKGPWSSRSSVMNRYHPHAIDLPCIEVALTEDEKVFEKGHTYFGSAVTVDFANQALKESFDIQLRKDKEEAFYLDKTLCGKDENAYKQTAEFWTDRYEWRKRFEN